MPDALTDRLKLAKPIQCRANNFLLLGNAPNVHHATGDAQSQFRPRINLMQKPCHPPENTCRWFNKLVVKAFKTNINKMVYQVRLIQLPPVKVVYPEKKTCHRHNKMGFGLVGDTKPFVSCPRKVSVRSTNLV